jgi:hypothetical protein
MSTRSAAGGRPVRRLTLRSAVALALALALALTLALGGVLLAGSACHPESETPSPPSSQQPAPSPPNVLLYIVDTLRADALGAYGNSSIETPRLDALAKQGTLFDYAFANSSWTRASVASIFTGLYPSRHRAETRDDRLPAAIDSLPEMLSRHGYTTGFVSTNANVAGCFGFGQGFDDMIELYERREAGKVTWAEIIADSEEVTRTAIEWIEGAQRPFFLVLHTSDPHDPYDPPKEFDRYMPEYEGSVDGFVTRYKPAQLDSADRQRIRALYEGEIAFNDHSFGSLVDHMKERGIFDDTLIIVTSDHGEEFWEYGPYRRGHGHAVTQAQIRVPLIVTFPRSQRVPQGVRERRAVQLVDLVPTVFDLLELPPPSDLDGRSLFAKSDSRLPRPLFTETRLRHPIHGVIEFPWKLVWNERKDRYALYHLTRPNERGGPVDARAVKGHAAVRKRLEKKLRGHLEAASNRPAAEPVSPDEVSDGVHEALRELGYVE